MPNWCDNSVIISNLSKDAVAEIKARLLKPNEYIYESLVGKHPEYMEEKWYDQNIDWWGCKWDTRIDEAIINYGDDWVSMSFDSPWSPPEHFCRHLSKIYNCKVRIEFEEGGCDFAGFIEFKQGQEVKQMVSTFLEGKYILDPDYFMQTMYERIEDGTYEDVLDLGDDIYFLPQNLKDELINHYNEQ